MNKFLHIRSSKFPVLPGEKDELCNDGHYGKALALYLQVHLRERGFEVPFVCCEDWGWWVELKGAPFAFGICIYSDPEQEQPVDYVCTDSVAGPRKWVWRRLRFVDTDPWVSQLYQALEQIFNSDDDVKVVAITDEFPW